MSDPQPHSTPEQQGDSIGRLSELLSGDPMERLDADMKHVLDVLGELGARPLEYSTPAMARRQPAPADAIATILARQNRGQSPDGVETEDTTIPNGEAGELPARLYRPLGLLSRLNPIILYFHGGGFVTGDLDSHDASARALARRTGAIVLSVAYRLAPEHRFPAAHDDAWTAWTWLVAQARELTGDPRRLAVAGEDAGANLAANIAFRARDEHRTQPVHQVLIHPVAGSDLATASYGETLQARPVGLPAMRWRFRQLLDDETQIEDLRINLLARENFSGLAPASIVLAAIDPLRSEGEMLAEAMGNAGTPVNCWTYHGVTQSFFGLGLIVTKALFAQTDVAQALSKAFAPGRQS
jgi:acetyl esterase/lipase